MTHNSDYVGDFLKYDNTGKLCGSCKSGVYKYNEIKFGKIYLRCDKCQTEVEKFTLLKRLD
jgi:hypothetical protein